MPIYAPPPIFSLLFLLLFYTKMNSRILRKNFLLLFVGRYLLTNTTNVHVVDERNIVFSIEDQP